MEALRINAIINQAVIAAIPALRPLLGHNVEMIALDLGPQTSGQPERRRPCCELSKQPSCLRAW